MALIQAIIIGFCLIIAGVPWAGALSAIVLVLGIAQLPALLVTLPAIGYIWSSGDYGNVEAILFSVRLFIAGMADKSEPPLLGRGVEAPMPVILIGALGGMAAKGILGMFVGAILLALGYQILKGWVHANPDAAPGVAENTTTAGRGRCCTPVYGLCRGDRCGGDLIVAECRAAVGPDFKPPEGPRLMSDNDPTADSRSSDGARATGVSRLNSPNAYLHERFKCNRESYWSFPLEQSPSTFQELAPKTGFSLFADAPK